MPVSGLILRVYRPSDFNTLLAIDQVCFPKAIAYGRREMQSYLQSQGSHCIVAEVLSSEKTSTEASTTVAGFVLTERGGEYAHVITLDVLAAYRRKSIGSLLLEAAEREAASRAAAWMYLETATTNKPAIALWNKHGYRESGTVKNYYGRGHDAFEMRKRLERKSQVKALP